MALRETEDNAYAKFWGGKQRALWYVMVFSGMVNSGEKARLPLLETRLIDGIFNNYSSSPNGL